MGARGPGWAGRGGRAGVGLPSHRRLLPEDQRKRRADWPVVKGAVSAVDFR